MPKPIKLLLGLASMAPILVALYVIARMVASFSEIAAVGGSVEPNQLGDVFTELLTVNLVTGALILLLLVFYLWHVLVRGARRDGTHQVLWIILLLLLPVFAMPIYWFLYVWPEDPAAGAARAARA